MAVTPNNFIIRLQIYSRHKFIHSELCTNGLENRERAMARSSWWLDFFLILLQFIHLQYSALSFSMRIQQLLYYSCAMLFGSFLLLSLWCVPFAFISPYYFQYFFSVIAALSLNKNRIQYNASTEVKEAAVEATTTKNGFMYYLFVICAPLHI